MRAGGYIDKAGNKYWKIHNNIIKQEVIYGELGLFISRNGIEDKSISEPTNSNVVVACGSWHSNDRIAHYEGALKNPGHSKEIDFCNVSHVSDCKIGGGLVLTRIQEYYVNKPFPGLVNGPIDVNSYYCEINLNFQDHQNEITIIFLSENVKDRFRDLFQKCLTGVGNFVEIQNFN